MPAILRRVVLGLLVIAVSGLSFLAGYNVSQRPTVASATTLGSPTALPPASAAERFRLLSEAWAWVSQEYLHRETINPTRMIYGAIRGMLQTLGDPNTYFVDPDERRVSESELQGGFEGIGVTVEMRTDGKLMVVSRQDDAPAARAGIQAGDVITHFDG